MTKEQEDWLTAELMDSMKLTEEKERTARRYIRRTVDRILIYCNRDTAISYRDGRSSQQAAVNLMKNYEASLNRYKKMNLPKDKRE